MGERYLVTGGAGFIGSAVVDELLLRGHEVRVLDNFSTGRRENLAHLGDEIEVVEGDIRSQEGVRVAVRGMDYVVHEAAIVSVPESVTDPRTAHEVNATGTLNLLLAARDEGVGRLVFASSCAVYGDAGELPKNETFAASPVSPYGVTKLAGEQYCVSFCRLYGLETVALRYFNVFGPRQDPHSEYSAVIPTFLQLVLAGRDPEVFGDGRQTRDFTFVGDVARATCDASIRDGVAGEVINIAAGEPHSLLDLIDILSRVANREVHPTHAPPRAGDVRDSFADIGKARRLLGYAREVTLEQGIRLMVEQSQ